MTSHSLSSSENHVCPWWVAYTFDNPLRRIIHNPEKVLGNYVKEGMTVMDLGCGMGYFSIGMARLVGGSGKVIAVDLQQKMLDTMVKRASRSGVADRISPRLCAADDLELEDRIDFILAFWMVHEVPDQKNFFNSLKSTLETDGKMLIAEPKMHVTAEDLKMTIDIAQSCGWRPIESPDIRFSHTVLLAPGSE
jgi:ubiquinone/menaquinone biosynthesis C-methylase UbiE